MARCGDKKETKKELEPKKTAPKRVEEPKITECDCDCDDDDYDDDEAVDVEELMYELAEEAFIDLLNERIKARIEKKLGKMLDEIAEDFSEAFAQQRKLEYAAAEEEIEEAPVKGKKGK